MMNHGREAARSRKVAAAMVRRSVKAVAVLDEIRAADEEGEMQPGAVAIHVRCKIGEIPPAFQLAAVVERRITNWGGRSTCAGSGPCPYAAVAVMAASMANTRRYPISHATLTHVPPASYRGGRTRGGMRQLTLRMRSRTRAASN